MMTVMADGDFVALRDCG
ncbi:MAG: hypothetical protein DMF56_27285 [Acidobacteria bacterium]|nr:MAG: hypothetical protein DMF56_27285 [Acidobacteriota bacterium]